MLKKTIKFIDFNGNEATEDLYFNLSKFEVTKFMAKYGGDLEAFAEELIQQKDLSKMVEFIQDLLTSSYGHKSMDGKHFVKNAQVREEFENSIAYAEIFELLLTDPNEAQNFITEVVANAMANSKVNQGVTQPAQPQFSVPEKKVVSIQETLEKENNQNEVKVATTKSVADMSPEELAELQAKLDALNGGQG